MDKLIVRRKLLRGSLSAPVVLTVSSASAQTVTSFGQCIARNANIQPTTNYVANADQWYRAAINVYPIKNNATLVVDYYFLDGTVYRKTSNPTSTLTPPLTGYTVGASQPWWQLVWFNSSGQPVGAGWQNPQNGLAATLSCQLSFG